MTREELIALARTHTTDIPKLSGKPWANKETLSNVSIVDAVLVSFESDQYPEKIMVILERDSGKFVLSGLSPRKH